MDRALLLDRVRQCHEIGLGPELGVNHITTLRNRFKLPFTDEELLQIKEEAVEKHAVDETVRNDSDPFPIDDFPGWLKREEQDMAARRQWTVKELMEAIAANFPESYTRALFIYAVLDIVNKATGNTVDDRALAIFTVKAHDEREHKST